MRIVRALALAGLLLGATVAVPVSSAHHATATTLAVAVAVSPSPVVNNAEAYVSVRATVGASCNANVTYSNNQHPSSFSSGTSYPTASNGVIAWFWNPGVSAHSGIATVTCILSGHSVHASYKFAIVQKS